MTKRLTYCQSTGTISAPDGLLACGYSGCGTGKNNPAAEDQHNVGPIPRAGYDIVGAPFDSDKHGPFCLRLEPQFGQDIHGRGGFLIHGDSVHAPGTASQGCIIMPRSIRQQIWNEGYREVAVVA